MRMYHANFHLNAIRGWYHVNLHLTAIHGWYHVSFLLTAICGRVQSNIHLTFACTSIVALFSSAFEAVLGMRQAQAICYVSTGLNLRGCLQCSCFVSKLHVVSVLLNQGGSSCIWFTPTRNTTSLRWNNGTRSRTR